MTPERILWTADKICTSCVTLADVVTDKVEFFGQLYPEFAEAYPTLFRMCAESGGGASVMETVRFLVGHLAAIEEKTATVESATSVVMKHMNEIYIDPLVASLPIPSEIQQG